MVDKVEPKIKVKRSPPSTQHSATERGTPVEPDPNLLGEALKSVYQNTIDERVPAEFLKLLDKLT